MAELTAILMAVLCCITYTMYIVKNTDIHKAGIYYSKENKDKEMETKFSLDGLH